MLQTKEKGNKAQKIAAAQKQTVQWLIDSYEIVQGSSYPKADVYRDYLTFCQEHGLSPTTAPAFGKVIRMAFPNLQCRRKGPRGEAKHHYRNFALKSSATRIGGSSIHHVPSPPSSSSLPPPLQSPMTPKPAYEESLFAPATPSPKTYTNSSLFPSSPAVSLPSAMSSPGLHSPSATPLPSLMDEDSPRMIGRKRAWENSALTRSDTSAFARKEPRLASQLSWSAGAGPSLERRNSLSSITSFLPATPKPEIIHSLSPASVLRAKTPPPFPLVRSFSKGSNEDFYLPPIVDNSSGPGLGGETPRLPDWFLSKSKAAAQSPPGATTDTTTTTTRSTVSSSCACGEGGGGVHENDGFEAYLEAAARDVDKRALLHHLKLSHEKLLEKEREVGYLNQKLQSLQELLTRENNSGEERRDWEKERERAREIEELVTREKKWLVDKGREWGLAFQHVTGVAEPEGSGGWRERERERDREEMERRKRAAATERICREMPVESNPWEALRLETAVGAFEQLQQQHHNKQHSPHSLNDSMHVDSDTSSVQDSSDEFSPQKWRANQDHSPGIDGVNALVAASMRLSAEMGDSPTNSSVENSPIKPIIVEEKEPTTEKTSKSKKKEAVPLVIKWIKSTYERLDPTDPPSDVPKEEVYENYRYFCSMHGIAPTNSATFGKLLRSVFPDLKTRRLGSRGNTKHHYNGIRMVRDSRISLDVNETPPRSASPHSPPGSTSFSALTPLPSLTTTLLQPQQTPPPPPQHAQTSQQHNELLPTTNNNSLALSPSRVVIPIPRRFLSSSSSTHAQNPSSASNSSQSSSETTSPQPSSPPSPSSSASPTPPNTTTKLEPLQQPQLSPPQQPYSIMRVQNSANASTVAK